VGRFARTRGAELPARLVASAKSWLCHRGVDLTQGILPWDAPADVQRISPVDAVTRYLDHIRNAWNHEVATEDNDTVLENQLIYLTVPASFDAVAREVTVQAAKAANFNNLTLLEEPQAAFYAWLQNHAGEWRDLIQVGESILVCDVGGGTTDFSLIQVNDIDGNLELQRVAVGEHILLGGDNMDLALAHAVRAKLVADGTKLDNWQFRTLWHTCRQAKERMLNDPAVESEAITLLGRGSSLLGGTIRTELTRAEIESVLHQGFFPAGASTDFPERKPQVGMREMGLPYATDAAVTRHLAYFLDKQVSSATEEDDAEESSLEVAFPTAVLFNGGVMKPDTLRHEILSALSGWNKDAETRELPSVDLDLAVALGAAYYGLVLKGRGIRIRAGASRSYYIGIESSMPAVPGIPTPMNALCVVPFGMEEGTEADITEREFGLVVGENAVFHFLASTTRKSDQVGEVMEDWEGELEKVTTMETLLPATADEEGGTILPVWLQSRVTEVGTLELWCVSRHDDREWKLEFNIREQE